MKNADILRHVVKSETATVGRSAKCDWTLPDPDKFLSGHHCTVTLTNGGVYLTDTSSNGMLHNGQLLPPRQQSRVKLGNGDTIHLGEYVIGVTINDGSMDLETVKAPSSDIPLSIDKFRPSQSSDEQNPWSDEIFQSKPAELSSANESRTDYDIFEKLQGSLKEQQPHSDPFINQNNAHSSSQSDAMPDNWFDDAGSGSDPFSNLSDNNNVTPSANSSGNPEPADPFDWAASQPAPPPVSVKNSKDSRPATDLKPFFENLGLSPDELAGKPEQILNNAGTLLYASVEGLRQLLTARTQLKSELRLDSTTFAGKDINPLKFSMSLKEALVKLLTGNSEDYLSVDRAVEEVVDDILAHQIALLSGVQSAMKSIILEFDPGALESRLEAESPLAANIPLQRQAKLWELYEQHFAKIQQKATDDFQKILAENFVSAYSSQLQQLRAKRKHS